jgi:2,4-dienoyl-CoA reductase-like NADH-dependent reductase (Old Yellow Enzyme family)|tara:strand:+ start:4177 stop:5448 length:1272 start_codon:yes stop_codon:yes gene_type:complete
MPSDYHHAMTMTTPPAVLTSPFTLANGAVLPNRLAKAAMSEALAGPDGGVSPQLIRLYGRWSSSRLGLMITGNVMIDRMALGEPGNVVVEDERDLDLLGDWAQAGTAHGTPLWMQINHPGKQALRGLNAENVAPSAVPFKAELSRLFPTPRALTGHEIENLIERYANTARIAKLAGFSGVQIHGAHGYLVSQFLSAHHNRRDDQWGGTPANRRRFVLAVYRAMRRLVGPDFPIGIKLNSADFQQGGFTEDESLATVKALAKAGIDLIEISGGNYEAPAMMLGDVKASTQRREAYFLAFAAKVREHTDVPLMVTGGFRTAAGMNAALKQGHLDLVGIARLLAVEPDVAHRLLGGHDPQQTIRPIKTGIGLVDGSGSMEVTWYARQLRRLSEGQAPRPTESGLRSFLLDLPEKGLGILRNRRLRA